MWQKQAGLNRYPTRRRGAEAVCERLARPRSHTGDFDLALANLPALSPADALVALETKFQVKDCHLRYGLLPSFVGTDILYAPQRLEGNQVNLPSTQWMVGLVDGNDSMLVAVWQSDTQAVSLAGRQI